MVGSGRAAGVPGRGVSRVYVLDNGRKSVPPSQMLRMVLLQWYDKVSDEESIVRSRYDLRWKVALGLEDHEALCAKFTLQTFRGKLLLSKKGRREAGRGAAARYRQRQTVEHRLARMMQLGARQAKYFGRAKTELQWLIAAIVANLTLALGHRNKQRAQNPATTSSDSPSPLYKSLWERITGALRPRSALWATSSPRWTNATCPA